jgi:hypothetical protein
MINAFVRRQPPERSFELADGIEPELPEPGRLHQRRRAAKQL